jgi:transcriptional regulator with GAF, ATPase, and Fis domain
MLPPDLIGFFRKKVRQPDGVTMQDIDENIFFKEAAKKMCSTLDIIKSLQSCLYYLKKYVPADGINLAYLDRENSGVQIVAWTGVTEQISNVDDFLPIPKEVWRVYGFEGSGQVRIINDTQHHFFGRNLARQMGLSSFSMLIIRLETDGRQIGNLGLIARGVDRYTPNHAHLLSLLHDPMVIAMSNAVQHQKVLHLMKQLEADNRSLRRKLFQPRDLKIIGAEKGLKEVMGMVHQVAPLQSSVLILGETGVGKELVANAIHRMSDSASGPFIKVNCGAIPHQLIDSELFGHEKGAFTGAVSRKQGCFEMACGGSILLDEIGELPLQAQVRLLRVLQNQEIKRVGNPESIPVNARIIAASHRNLEKMVASGDFREDLWFRLNVFPIQIPPLRKRLQDIRPLLHHFVNQKARELRYPTPPPVAPASVEHLMEYDWPGNVRELENLVERALIKYRGQRNGRQLFFDPIPPNKTVAQRNKDRIAYDLPMRLDQMKRVHILRVLDQTKGKIHGPGGAAELLGINANTLRSKMDKLGIWYKKKQSG